MCGELVLSDDTFVLDCEYITNSKYNTSSCAHLILIAFKLHYLGNPEFAIQFPIVITDAFLKCKVIEEKYFVQLASFLSLQLETVGSRLTFISVY